MKDSSMKTLRRVLRYLKKRWHMLAASIVLAAASVAGTLYVPILVGNAIDCILGPGAVAHAQIMTLLSRVAAVAGITALLQWLMSDLNNRITFGVVRDVRRDAFENCRSCRCLISTRIRAASWSAASSQTPTSLQTAF